MHFRPELSWEFLPADEIALKTVRALRNHVKHAKECSPFYRSYLDDVLGLDIQSLDDYSKLPFTDRTQLMGQSSQFLGVNPVYIVETVLTTGTAGKPMPFIFTASDLERITFSYALSMHSVGMSAVDRVLILSSLDECAMDGMALYRGTLLTQANVLRAGVCSKNPLAAVNYLQLFKPTVLIGAPSVVRRVALECAKNGYDTTASSVQKIIGTGESLLGRDLRLNPLAEELERVWGAKVYSLYSATELAVSYCTSECGAGAHAHPELVYTEIVDEAGNVLPDGEVGELVATPLGVEGVPLVRFRTGDITFKVPGSCTCGRNSVRIGPILGRREQRIILNGVAMYSHLLTGALDSIEEIKDHLTIIEQDGSGKDTVSIHIAAVPAALEKTAHAIKAATGMHIPLLISNVPTIHALRGDVGKKGAILDKRQKARPAAAPVSTVQQ